MALPGAAVEPKEYPPPFDEASLIAEPTDPEDERIEVGRRDRGRRPCGPRLREPASRPAGRRAGAHGAAGRGPGRRGREGQGLRRAHAERGEHEALGDEGAVPGSRPVGLALRLPGGHQGRRLPADEEGGAAAEADAAQLPQPRQLRDLGLEALALPRREGRGEGRLHPHRDGCRQAPGRGQDRARHPLGRSRPRQGRQAAGQLRAGLGRCGEHDCARRGHPRTSHPGRHPLLRPAGLPAVALGARRQGGLEGRRSRSTA